MAAAYKLLLYSVTGVQIAIIDDFVSFSYSKRENEIGALELELKPNVKVNLLKIDNSIEIWRSVDGEDFYLENESPFFIRGVTRTLSENGERTIKVHCLDGVSLLSRRIVAYEKGNDYTDKSDLSDYMMKDIVKENFSTLAFDTNRIISSDYFTVQSNADIGVMLAKEISYRNVLNTLEEIVNETKQAGVYISFDVVRTGPYKFEFRTYQDQRGDDLTDSGIVFSYENGNFTDLELSYICLDEFNYVYCGGTGAGEEREVVEAYDATRVNLSPFTRIEAFVDGSQTDDGSILLWEAKNALYEARASRYISGKIIDTPFIKYGINYGFGDKIKIKFENDLYVARIEAVNISHSAGVESLDIQIHGIEDA